MKGEPKCRLKAYNSDTDTLVVELAKVKKEGTCVPARYWKDGDKITMTSKELNKLENSQARGRLISAEVWQKLIYEHGYTSVGNMKFPSGSGTLAFGHTPAEGLCCHAVEPRIAADSIRCSKVLESVGDNLGRDLVRAASYVQSIRVTAESLLLRRWSTTQRWAFRII